ncbi:MAG: TetR/AcrR family transcriptional regulator [Rhodococcus sp.]|nr:TetR/AcrR family transcriptional regulator [Rhodococcus sp. (in: high G+C Gram-positive bacteria)]
MSGVAEPGRRTGRRPGNLDTGSRILDAARTRFAQNGYDKVSIRSVADDAEVDPALVHHYFGTKRQLFIASIELPVDPDFVLDQIRQTPPESMGAAIAELILNIWESPQRDSVVALFRSAMAGQEVDLIRNFLLQVVLRDVAPRVDNPVGSGSIRVQLVASQLMGLLAARHVLHLDPLAQVPVGELVDVIAPTLQRYLTGHLPAQS